MKQSIQEHYADQARRLGSSPQSTMRDLCTRQLEVARLEWALGRLIGEQGGCRVLEIGCGNGYALSKLSKRFDCEFFGIDASRAMIGIASGRGLKNVSFRVDDILRPRLRERDFDLVFSERCLINLGSWRMQQRALENVRKLLRARGYYVMLEMFADGLAELNGARKALGLERIPPPWHNRFFKKTELQKYIEGRFENALRGLSGLAYDNFLSSYYFGSRVLYPALIRGTGEIEYNNKFVKFFSGSPAFGNYSPIQLCILRKT